MDRSKQRRMYINMPMLLRVMGWLLYIEAVFMLIPLITCLIYDEPDYMSFAIAIVITVVAGILMTTLIQPERTEMGKREGFLLTAQVWVVFSFFGMIPFLLCNGSISVSDAFFEAMSGFTTTGASTMPQIEHLSKGILLWRCLMQWIGGMGIILFTLAVVPMLNSSGGMQMFNAEVTGITHEKLRPRISQTAKRLWGMYIFLTAMLAVLLWLGPMDTFESICHAFSTISTGGLSTANGSIASFNSLYVDVVITVFMFLGGVNFVLLIQALSGKPQAIVKNDVFKVYVGIILVMSVLFVIAILCRGQYTGWKSITIDPVFQIVSVLTSTGYTAVNQESWGPFVLSLIIVMMYFGACAGSTSGGAKIDRMIFLWKNIRNEIYRCVHPNSVMSVRINDKRMSSELVNKVIAFLCIYTLLILLGGTMLTALNMPLVDSFYSSFSAISNTGLSASITGYGGSFDLVPDLGKWILSFLMLVGRLELFTVLILFTPGFWRK
ncbi:MAG: TrkH family potassium uptake protein [Muribaculaceae bacterium]|nr:TrkH family potassium uptake protein [Muribaculaceae bacterium]